MLARQGVEDIALAEPARRTIVSMNPNALVPFTSASAPYQHISIHFTLAWKHASSQQPAAAAGGSLMEALSSSLPSWLLGGGKAASQPPAKESAAPSTASLCVGDFRHESFACVGPNGSPNPSLRGASSAASHLELAKSSSRGERGRSEQRPRPKFCRCCVRVLFVHDDPRCARRRPACPLVPQGVVAHARPQPEAAQVAF